MDIVTAISIFGYHKPDDETRIAHAEVRNLYLSVALALIGLPKGNERDMAIESLRQSCMYANAAVALTNSPIVLNELDDSAIDMIHQMIVGADKLPSRESMVADIKTYINRSGLATAE